MEVRLLQIVQPCFKAIWVLGVVMLSGSPKSQDLKYRILTYKIQMSLAQLIMNDIRHSIFPLCEQVVSYSH